VNSPPLESESLKHYGVVPRIVKEAFLLEGVKVSYKFYPWRRAYQESKLGTVHGTIQWFYSEDRAKDHFYSNPVMNEKVVWFHLKSTPFEWHDLGDLKGTRIGALAGFTYNSEFYESIKNKKINVNFVDSSKQVLSMMLLNRVDVYPETIDVGYFEIRKNFPNSTANLFTNHHKAFINTTSHLLLSRQKKESPLLLKKFNEGLKKLKKNGLYDRYLIESRRGDYLQ